jgi:hypothetical protein
MKPVMCLVLLVFFMRQCKQHVLQMTSSAVGEPSILGSIRDLHDFWLAISGYFLQIWRYEHSVVTGRNRLTIWTEKSVGHFFLIFCAFFQSSLAFIYLLWRFFVARALQYFLKLLLNICPLSWLKPDLYVQGYKALCVCSSYLYTTGKKHHIRNSNKKPLRGPCYRLVNAVKLSLQSGRNTHFIAINSLPL